MSISRVRGVLKETLKRGKEKSGEILFCKVFSLYGFRVS